MKTPETNPLSVRFDRHGVSGMGAFLLLAFGIPWGIWNMITLLGGTGDPLFVAFNAAAGWFVVLAVAYLALHGIRDLAWCSVTALLTLEALLEFVIVPGWRFFVGSDQLDSFYIQAMALTLLGFVGFWIGSLVSLRNTKIQFVPQLSGTSNRVAFFCVSMFIIGLSGKFALWKLGLLSYMADTESRESALPYISWLNVLGNFLTAALVVSSIEKIGKQSNQFIIRITYWLSLIGSLAVGAISGMKSSFVAPILVVALVYGVTRRRFSRTALLAPLLLLVIYPFNTAYRSNLNSGYREQANTLGGMEALISKTFADMASSPLGISGQAQTGTDRGTSRLSSLAFVHDIVSLPAPALLNGDEKVWLAPIYPLIPRFLWNSKPVLDKGVRLSVALGRPDTTSSAVTPIADLFMLYGYPGVFIGMLVYGVAFQLYMNFSARRPLSERGVLVYLSLLMPLINLENSVVAQIDAVIQGFITVLLVSYFIYGPSVPLFSSSAKGALRARP
jgi:hypothetical protein